MRGNIRRETAFVAWIIMALFLSGATAIADSDAPSFLRRPDVRGDLVVFTSESDLWTASISNGNSRRVTSHPGLETNARFSPDGRRLAFNAQYDGGTDVYVMPTEGGIPQRLTWDPRGARVVGWTPDGSAVLFLSRRANPENRPRLWRVPVRGGLPEVLPIPRADIAALSPDGRRVAYVPVSAEWQHWKYYRGGQADDIWITDITKNTFERATRSGGIDTTPAWAGDALFFISERDGLANLYRLDIESGKITRITEYTEAEARYPASDGKSVVFQHGDGLARFDIAAGTVSDLDLHLHSDRIHARPKRVPAADFLNSASIGPTGKRVLIEARGQILSLPVEEGAVRLLAPLSGTRSQRPAWSADGKRIAFISDRSGEDQVWVAASDGSGSPRRLTRDHQGPLNEIIWSPDGKYLATSDREQRLLLVEVETGAVTVVDQSEAGTSYGQENNSSVFSPDGKWLAFHSSRPGRGRSVYLHEIATGRKTALTPPGLNAHSPCWDPKGKLLFFLADRRFAPRGTRVTRFFTFDPTARISFLTLAADTPSPMRPKNDEEGSPSVGEAARPGRARGDTAPASKKTDEASEIRIDLPGIQARVGELPVPADDFGPIAAVEGRLLFLVPASPAEGRPGSPEGGRDLRAYDLKNPRKRKITTVAQGIGGFQVSADSRRLLIRTGRVLRVMDAAAARLPEDAPRLNLDGVSLDVDPAAEWKQIFEESWRIARDFFYAPNMHGVDWEAIRPIYAARLKNVGDRGELNEVLGDMIAELNTGHAYVGGGDMPRRSERVRMGYLGADFAPDDGGRAFRITRIFPGDGIDLAVRSPLLSPGLRVKEGDYILEIDGRAVSTDRDIQALLSGTAGRITALTVNSRPVPEGSREILVEPLDSERRLRYYAWVESRRAYVLEHGGPDLGYIHLPDMSRNGMIEFGKHYYANLDKDGMIFDDRYNTGGYISSMLILQMARRPITWFKPRHGRSWTRQSWGFPGHSAMLVNENSASNGEEFPDIFRREKLGPVIGKRTWGGEVGSGGGYRLIDGGRINIPNYANWADGEWIIEGTGVEPDIVVEQDPAAVLAGRDPQLDRAIEWLREKITAEPVERPTHPPFPIRKWRK